MMSLLFFLLAMMVLGWWTEFWLSMVWGGILSLFFFFFSSVGFNYNFISYSLGLDIYSYWLILLSMWICMLMLLASELLSRSFWGMGFVCTIALLLFSLFLAFGSMNLFVFYLFFELSLIPTLFLVVGWGYQPERLQAGVYLLFYTMLFSLPMMISVFYVYVDGGSMFFYFFNFYENLFIFFCVNMVFFVKIPMFFVHLWLPKAHVEAPISGSMILAGVMLKLGGYGLLRLLFVFGGLGLSVGVYFMSISLIGGVLVSLVCLRQSDMKSLIAYSSVSHMGMVVSSFFTYSSWGMMGGFIMMLAHGLCSSGLFCLANTLYERVHSRSLYLNKGLINIVPSISLWMFLLVSSNMAAPPSLNLLSEISIIACLVGFCSFNMVPLALLSFFGAVYSLFLYSYSQHGMFSGSLYSFFLISFREFLLFSLHWFPLNFFFKGWFVLLVWVV
uniref:NADH-ubiquinone oxidoreductase chain 4 n=1 Tax=Melittomma sp. MEL01 TaxID=1205634 RepID=A0A0S2MPP9_9CUCU|nr:NADH deshydrogenase subunit 4 [Melittomma sp. MEL01]